MNRVIVSTMILALVLLGCYQVQSMDKEMEKKTETSMEAAPQHTKTAIFAGGCFWCTEADFEKIDGVVEAVSGYTGGSLENPTYEQVSSGSTGHVEAVKVIYDPDKITYRQLLQVFWRHVDPTDAGGQFVDRGPQYRSVIFYANETEKRQAEASQQRLAESGRFDKPIVTDILPAGPFYRAEEYHQDYYKKNPLRYRWYRSGSGRDQFLEAAWPEGREIDTMEKKMESKKMEPMSDDMSKGQKMAADKDDMKSEMTQPSYTVPPDDELRRSLTPMQYRVTREEGTEPPFKNAYWDNHEAGIYVDVISGEPLFSSTDKFESGTGWPSFTRPLEPDNIVEKSDNSFFMKRTEVRSKHANSHLGHVFNDGPEPTGLRYCINSAALRFIPKSKLENSGYGRYRSLFESDMKASGDLQ